MANEQSAKFTLNNNDWKKIGKGAAIAGAGAVLTYAVAVIPTLDFGNPGVTPVVCAVLSIVVNAGLKWVQGQSK